MDTGIDIPLHEFLWYDSSPTYRFNQIPKAKYAPKWEKVAKVIHRCAMTCNVIPEEKVNPVNRHQENFWGARCHCDEGVISIYLYAGEKTAPLMEERQTPQSGRQVIPPNDLGDVLRNCHKNKQEKPEYRISTSSIIDAVRTNAVIYVSGQVPMTRRMNTNSQEIPVHQKVLHIQTIVVTDAHITDATNPYIVTSVCVYKIPPHGKARRNLWIAVPPPCGTFVTLAPMNDGQRLQRELCDHRIDYDITQEAIATVINRTAETTLDSK